MENSGPAQRLNAVQQAIRTKHDVEGLSYAKIAQQLKLSKGTTWRIAHGHIPTDAAIRCQLGLEPCMEVSTLYHNVMLCSCGRTFVPNTAKRRRCFVCVPFRSRL